MDRSRDENLVYIVDDDPAVRDALSVVLSLEGFAVKGFRSGDDFLHAARKVVPACIILDVHMPGKSGIDILGALNAESYPAPVFIISGQGDIPTAVQAIRNGALDFIEKPFNAETLVTRVREAIAAEERRRARASAPDQALANFQGADRLTMREREVLQAIAAGASSKVAGRALGISPRTVEVHRARIMEKLDAKNAADLVRIVLTGGSGKA
jgi:two-component system response regulator FixJ